MIDSVSREATVSCTKTQLIFLLDSGFAVVNVKVRRWRSELPVSHTAASKDSLVRAHCRQPPLPSSPCPILDTTCTLQLLKLSYHFNLCKFCIHHINSRSRHDGISGGITGGIHDEPTLSCQCTCSVHCWCTCGPASRVLRRLTGQLNIAWDRS